MPNKLLSVIHAQSIPAPFQVVQGMNRADIQSLLSYTEQDSVVQSNTADFHNSDGSPGRFSSQGSYETWYRQGKFVYALKGEQGELLGIAWFSKQSQEFAGITYGFTFALRLYGMARGVGLAKPFASAVSNHFFTTTEYQNSAQQGIWLRTSRDNLPALKTYHSLGYNQVEGAVVGGKITMVLQYQSL